MTCIISSHFTWKDVQFNKKNVQFRLFSIVAKQIKLYNIGCTYVNKLRNYKCNDYEQGTETINSSHPKYRQIIIVIIIKGSHSDVITIFKMTVKSSIQDAQLLVTYYIIFESRLVDVRSDQNNISHLLLLQKKKIIILNNR